MPWAGKMISGLHPISMSLSWISRTREAGHAHVKHDATGTRQVVVVEEPPAARIRGGVPAHGFEQKSEGSGKCLVVVNDADQRSFTILFSFCLLFVSRRLFFPRLCGFSVPAAAGGFAFPRQGRTFLDCIRTPEGAPGRSIRVMHAQRP